MARSFASASSQYLSVSSTPITAAPLTMNCWFHMPSTSSNHTFVCVGDTGGFNDYFYLGQSFGSFRYAVGSTLLSTSGVTTNTWHMGTGVSIAANNHAVYRNGGNKSTSTTTYNASGIDSIGLGVWLRQTVGTYHNGRLAHVALWNVGLSDAEVAALYNGGVVLPPYHVRPDALVAWYPLYDADGDIDWAGNGTYDLTPTNSPTYAAHVPTQMLMPSSSLLNPSGGAPPAASEFPFERYYMGV